MRKQKEFLIDVSDYSGAQVVDNDAFFTRDTDAYLIFRPTNTYINYDSALLYLTNLSNGATLLDLPTTKIDDSYVEFKLTPDILETYGAWKGQILFQLNGSTAASSAFEFTVNRFLTDSRPATPVEVVTVDQIRKDARLIIETLEAMTYDNDSLVDVLQAKDGELTLDARIRRDVSNLENKKADKAEVAAQLAQKETQINALQSTKVDIGGAQQITWANINQEAREIMLGDKPMPVVGVGSVGSDNIIERSVEGKHLHETYNFRGTFTAGDTNSYTDSGIYYLTAGVANLPEAVNSILINHRAGNRFAQIVIPKDNPTNVYIKGGDMVNIVTLPWKNLKDDITSTFLTQIPQHKYPYLQSNDDLNDVVTDGKWVAINPINGPFLSTWNLEVKTYRSLVSPTANYWGTQTVSTTNISLNYTIYERNFTKYADRTEFGEWVRITSNDSAEPLKDKVIVNFGDSIFGNIRGESSVSNVISSRTGANVINAGFGGCRMSQHALHWDAFSMYRLADAAATGDWTLQDAAISQGKSDNWNTLRFYFENHLNALKELNWENVDIITISYGLNDHSSSVQLENPDDLFDTSTYKGALRYSLKRINEAYPHIKILIISPTYRYYLNESGEFVEDSNTKVFSGQTLTQFVDAVEEVGIEFNTQTLNAYRKTGINRYNRNLYYNEPDSTHFNASGNKRLGDIIGAQLELI